MLYQDSYYLPEKISRVAQGHHNHYQNPGLILDKYVPRTVIDDTKQKGPWLRTLCKEYAIDKELVQAIYQRWQAFLTAQHATRFDATLEWRMIVGLGGESVLETDITLHHLYGIPFIPGSALKGLTRAFASAQKEYAVSTDQSEGAELKPSLEEKTDHPDIRRIFGTQEGAGTVIFFDALPTNDQYRFAVDIMNPHYPDYYSSLQSGTIKAPANNQQPNPITFLTIQDAVFTFALAVRDPQHQGDLLIVQTLLRQAIEKYGVGGKTSAGYGYFKKLSPAMEMNTPITHNDENAIPLSPVVDPDLKKAESFKLEIESLKLQDVAGQIQSYYQKWQKLASQEARIMVAQAIIEKVRQAKREKASADKSWYQELQAFLAEAE